MAKGFVSTKELDYIDELTRELMQNISIQEVFYYAISLEHTVADDLYNEAIEKTWFAPVQISARIDFDNPTVTTTEFTLDSQYSLEVYFHTEELRERNVKPTEGDFVEFGEIIFEVTAVTLPQLVFGQVNKKIMTKCVCVPSREGQFQVNGDYAKFVSNTHPVEPTTCTKP